MRRRSSCFTACSFARTRSLRDLRLIWNLPRFDRPQMKVKPRKVKVSGLPSPRRLRLSSAKRPNSISRVFSGCSDSANSLRRPLVTDPDDPLFQNARLEPFADQADDALVADPMLDEADQPVLADRIEERTNVGVDDEVHPAALNPAHERAHRIMRAAPGPEPVREPEEVLLVDRVQNRRCCPLDDLVLQGRNRQRSLPPVRLRDINPPGRLRSIRSPVNTSMQVLELALEVCLVVLPCQPVHARGGILLEIVEHLFEQVGADMVEQRGEPLLLLSLAVRRMRSSAC